MVMEEPERTTPSSGNVFEDLGFGKPEEEQAKAELVRVLRHIIEEWKLTQKVAGETIGLAQPDLSQLLRGRTIGYSVDCLFRFVMAFDRDIEIGIKPRPKKQSRSRITVKAA